MEDGSTIMSLSLVSSSTSLVSDPWTDVENFLEKIALDCSTVGDFCSKDCDLVGRLIPLLVSQSHDVVVQILDASFDRTDQKLFGQV